jgi:hypothetical protein
MGIPVLQGRGFTDRDDRDHPLALVIDSAIAESVFPGQNPIGRRLDIQDLPTGARTGEIVGVVPNVKEGKIEDAPSFNIYVPFRQMNPVAVPWVRYRTYWVLRGSLPPAAMESAFRREVHAEDSAIAISSAHTLEQVAGLALAPRRFSLLIVGFFAGTALILTVAGIYSVIAFGVAQRTREIGVRLALGASKEQISGLVVRGGLDILWFGAPMGILASLALSHLISAQLYGVSPHDPGALVAAVLLIAGIAFLACWLPARKATRIDPIEALRSE